MADSLTTNLSLTKPEPGASADSWGTKLNDNFDDLDGLFDSGPVLKVSKGGTGAATAADARTSLGLGSDATGSNLSSLTDASAARTALGLVIGTNVPSPTGTGASGNWNINITGNAATATSATTASNGGVTSVDSTTGAITLSSLTAFSRSLSGNGYQKLPGGLIIQWGTQSNIGIGYGTVSFPISFPSVCLGVVGSLNRSAAGDARWPYSWNTSNFQCPADNCDTFWVAFGY